MRRLAARRWQRWTGLLLAAIATPVLAEPDPGGVAVEFVKTYCLECHSGPKPKGDVDLAPFDSGERFGAAGLEWETILARVREMEMPPEKAKRHPSREERAGFLAWAQKTLQEAACAGGPQPGPAMLRRLNRSEYSASVRDLLGIHWDAGEALPADGAGGEGFDNAAETLFVSPIHGEKYLESARLAVEYAFADTRSLSRFLVAEPGAELSAEDAARNVLEQFLPRAFRRGVTGEEIEEYHGLFRSAHAAEGSYWVAMRLTLQAVLVSPKFLFIVEEPNRGHERTPITDYELATRLSYFLWGSIPDEILLELAADGKLSDPDVLREQVRRMLGGRNAAKVREFSQNFIEQWLGTRALGREFKPDKSIGSYDSELEGGMKYEPVFFFNEIVTENRSLLELLDADYTYANRRLARHYRIRGEFREQPKRVELKEGDRRGGLLGMAAVLAVSSYPHRTSPVLRGKWILETLLGDAPPPPPPDVPALEEAKEGQAASSLRERLELHRQNSNCAVCHDRIDPLGFGLENYGVLGHWREEADGHPVDARGKLPNGREFNGPEELKQVLLERKDQFARHLTRKMLGYALGRGLTGRDNCAVDLMVDALGQNGYRAHDLILGIIESVPFRFKAGVPEHTEPN